MSRFFAPRWTFSAEATDAAGDPHLKPGVHLRILTCRALGMPAAPFVVYRLPLGIGRGFLEARDIAFADSKGLPLLPPFEVTPDNPVRAFFPPLDRGVCIFFQIKATPALPERLRVEAEVNTARGRAVIASSTNPPYQIGATPIESVRISGRGSVESLFWIDGKRMRQFASEQQTPWRALGLPVVAAKRYAGLPDAGKLSANRVINGAPLRFGLHDNPDAANPSTAPAATDADEDQRVAELAPPLQDFLKTLLNDTSAPPGDLFSDHDLIPNEGAQPAGILTVNILDSILQAGLDTGIGRWMGFMDRDEAPEGNPGDVIAYFVYGVWQLHRERLEQELGKFLAKPIVDLLSHDVLHILPSFPFPFDTSNLVIDGDGLLLETIACATIGSASPRPNPPLLSTPRNPYPRPPFPEGPTAWSPRLVPPAAARELMIPAAGLNAAATVALARRAGAITGLNRRLPITKRALSILPSSARWSVEGGSGTFHDSDTPPGDVFYRAAQTDWFGRWSDWVEIHGGPGVRPLPPEPALLITYEAPAFGVPIPSGPLSGVLHLRVPVPAVATLPPGSNLLAFVRISVNGPTVTDVDLPVPNPNAPPVELAQSIPGPGVARAASLDVTITAQWFDTAGQGSPSSPPTALTLYDPRPPEPAAVLTPTLDYAARPDVMGRSRVTLRWTASPAQASFRIFYADDSRLGTSLSRLSLSGDPRAAQAAAILDEISAAPDLPHKAAAIKQHAAFFDRTLFEQLTTAPLPRPADGHMLYENDVSASYRALALYRVVALSVAQVEVPFAESPLLAFGVPNTAPPAVPVLAVEPVRTAATPRARVTITVPAGLVHAVEYRLRRVSGAPPDPITMPVVEVGQMAAPTSDGSQRKVVVDSGDTILGPGTLSDWTRYQWVAEVRGGPEPGAGPPSQWSPPSTPVSLMFVPAAPPVPATLSATATAGQIELKWTHPDPLRAGQVGDYRVELYRRLPGKPDQLAFSISADANESAGGRAPDRTGEFHYSEPEPARGTTYRVIVRDPIGRAGLPSNAFLIG
jgi:hypothetical protein